MGKRKRLTNTLNAQFFPIYHELVDYEKSPLLEYIGSNGLLVYILLGCKMNGKKGHDENLILTFNEVKHLMSSQTFARMKFRLRAYRIIKVTEWGRKEKKPTRFEIIMKWRTLLRMPERLDEIHELVTEYEKASQSVMSSKRTKRLKLENIKRKIFAITV